VNPIEKFLVSFLAGGNTELLSKPELSGDKHKYVAIGTTVLITAILASLSGGYAFFTIFKILPISTALGGLWGFMILNLDRLIILQHATELHDDDDSNNTSENQQ